MSDHYGNLTVHGKIVTPLLEVTNIDADSIEVDSIVINGTPFDPANISITGDFDLSAVQVQIDAISGAVDDNTSSIATNTSNILTNSNSLSVNSIAIGNNASNILTNASNISTNSTDILVLQTGVSGLETDVIALSAAIDGVQEESTVVASSGGSITVTQLGSTFNVEAVVLSGGGAPTSHNDLIGIQGGQVGQYNHLSNAQYADLIGKTEVSAVSGALQTAIGNIVEESTTMTSSGGSLTITQVGTNFNIETVVPSGGGSPTSHNDLIGIQGGEPGQYYHLNSSQYNDYIGQTEVASVSGALETLISTNASNISGNTINIGTNTSDIGTLSTAVGINTTNIGTNATNISNNAAAISLNAGDIVDLQNQVDSISVSAGGSLPMDINSNLTSNHVVAYNDSREIYVGFDTTSGSRTCTMHASPAEGNKVFVKDEQMSAFTNNITINGNGNDIDCCATYSLNYNNAGVLFLFAGGQWRVLRN